MVRHDKEHGIDFTDLLQSQWRGLPAPHAGLLEQRVLELEHLGMVDIEEIPGIPSSMRQYAIASLQRSKPPFFVTHDDELLFHREILEGRYGLKILSIQEAILLLRETNGPPN
jgi:hypothetical protein